MLARERRRCYLAHIEHETPHSQAAADILVRGIDSASVNLDLSQCGNLDFRQVLAPKTAKGKRPHALEKLDQYARARS